MTPGSAWSSGAISVQILSISNSRKNSDWFIMKAVHGPDGTATFFCFSWHMAI